MLSKFLLQVTSNKGQIRVKFRFVHRVFARKLRFSSRHEAFEIPSAINFK